MKYRPKTKPFPHQAKATLRAARAKNFGLFMEPRTGKSKVALDYVGMHTMAGNVSRVLITCPATVVETWEHQIALHFPYPYFAETSEYTWSSDTSDGGYTGAKVRLPGGIEFRTPHFLILSHEELRYRKRVKGKWVYTRQKEVEDFAPDVVIDDESHRHKRAGGVGAQFLWRSVERMRRRNVNGQPWVLLLTGTPNPRDWRDLFAQYRIMDSSVFGTNKADFEEEYVVYGHGKRQFTVVNWRNKKDLISKIRAHSCTVTEKEAGLVNRKFVQRLTFELPATAKKIYREMAEDLVAELESGEVLDAANAGVRRMRLLQITGGFTTEGELLHSTRLERTKAYLELLVDQQQPFILYARYKPEVRALTNLCETMAIDCWTIRGGQTRSDRTEQIRGFQQGRGARAMVAQVDAASVGIELSAAREVVYYSLPDGWESWRQSMSRVLGPNQTGAVRYTIVQAKGTLDPSVLQGLIRKEDMHAELMKDPKRFLGMIQ